MIEFTFEELKILLSEIDKKRNRRIKMLFDKALKNVTGLDGKPEDVKFIQLYGQAEMLAVVERTQHIGGHLEKRTNFTIAIPRNENGIDFDKFVENVSEAIRQYDLQYCNWGKW